MEIPRLLETILENQIGKQKVILLYGTRRAGKTHLIENIAARHEKEVLILQGEDIQTSSILQNRTVSNYQRLLANKKILIIDEAQAISDIGLILKLMIDNIKGITIIATGSSSFDLASSAGEPLVGRQLCFQLYPIAQVELSPIENLVTTVSNLEERLIFGSYPELWHLSTTGEKALYLKSLISSYIFKDILVYENIKGADIIYRLLQLIAFQVGSEVSTNELSRNLQIGKNTVDRYLDLLTKVFVIYPLSGYSKNLRKEVTKSKKWYFHDNGLRNALINNFAPLQSRNDIGLLWEQYILSERIKFNSYRGYHPQYYFWRTYDQQEIDLIEVNDQQEIAAFECKWSDGKVKIPEAFRVAYPDAAFNPITKNNYLDFIS